MGVAFSVWFDALFAWCVTNVILQVDWAKEHMEKQILVKDVFEMNEVIDVIGVTKGKGFKGELRLWNTHWLELSLMAMLLCLLMHIFSRCDVTLAL